MWIDGNLFTKNDMIKMCRHCIHDDVCEIKKNLDENLVYHKCNKFFPSWPLTAKKEVLNFARTMNTKLKLCDVKKGDSWKTCGIEFLYKKLFEEIAEWEDGEYMDELVDIANICLLLHERNIMNRWFISGIDKRCVCGGFIGTSGNEAGKCTLCGNIIVEE